MLCRHGRKKLPPGPPALLFIAKFLALGGSVYQIGPIVRSMHIRHGPIISIWLGRTFVFVGDRHLAHSALVKGGGNFDSRPPSTEIVQLLFPQSIIASPCGAYWRLVRRNLHTQSLAHVSLSAAARQRTRDAIVGSLRRDVVVTLRPLLTRCFLELLVWMCLGVWLGQGALDELQETQTKVFLAATGFPVFSIFPALSKRLLRRRWAGHVALRERQMELILPLIRARGDRDHLQLQTCCCYADSLLQLRVAEEGGRRLTDDEMVDLCLEFIYGAKDTSLSLMEWIMAELVNHPDVQAKVHEEVRGRPELLSEADLRGNGMPYLKAVVLEGLRLHPGVHLIFPHGVLRDTELGGYMVPKGAEINFMVADFGLDGTMWAAPRQFRPERFLEGGDEDLDITGGREIKMAPFGAGRRMCPGYTLGLLHVQYLVGSLVRAFLT